MIQVYSDAMLQIMLSVCPEVLIAAEKHWNLSIPEY